MYARARAEAPAPWPSNRRIAVRRLRGAVPVPGCKISHRAVRLAGLLRRYGRQVKAHRGQLRPAGDAELREDVVKVAGHGAVRHVEALANLPVRQSLRDHPRDLQLL